VEAIYFTLVAAVLYLASNWIVDRLEIAAGKRFKNRSLLFFAIILVLALATFSLIRAYTGNP
jgi:predicted PurR-regulated permease PerM